MKKFLKFIGVAILAGFFAVALTGCAPNQAQKSADTSLTNTPSSTGSTSTPAVISTPTQTQTTPQSTTFASPSKTSGCHESNGLPDSACTPGATNSAVTQDTIKSTICVSGYTATIRPATSYTNNLKTQQIVAYGYSDKSLSDYEEDHLIALELGGSPTDAGNLWPEPYNLTYSAKAKDKVENYLHSQVCGGSINLVDAQKEIATNWISVYTAHYGTISGGSSSDSDDAVTSSTSTGSSSSSIYTPAPTTINNGGYPAGTSGICNDGTYTKAVNHQGACSHHKGVKQWL